MSYILDALKKADAEREQGSIPGLHSRPQAPAPGDDDDEPKTRIQPVVWVGAGMAICLIGVLSWQLLSRDAAVPAVTAEPALAPEEPMAQAMPPTQQTMAPPPVSAVPEPAQPAPAPAPAPSPAPAPPAPPAPLPTARQAPAAPRPAAAPAPAATRSPVQAAPPSVAPNSTPAAPANPPPGQAGGPRIPSLNELPEHIRREIPQLTIGGAMYSDTPAQRMLIINSQVFREGDQPYQGLMLEEIRLKSAVFQYRGQRYSVNY